MSPDLQQKILQEDKQFGLNFSPEFNPKWLKVEGAKVMMGNKVLSWSLQDFTAWSDKAASPQLSAHRQQYLHDLFLQSKEPHGKITLYLGPFWIFSVSGGFSTNYGMCSNFVCATWKLTAWTCSSVDKSAFTWTGIPSSSVACRANATPSRLDNTQARHLIEEKSLHPLKEEHKNFREVALFGREKDLNNLHFKIWKMQAAAEESECICAKRSFVPWKSKRRIQGEAIRRKGTNRPLPSLLTCPELQGFA